MLAVGLGSLELLEETKVDSLLEEVESEYASFVLGILPFVDVQACELGPVQMGVSFLHLE